MGLSKSRNSKMLFRDEISKVTKLLILITDFAVPIHFICFPVSPPACQVNYVHKKAVRMQRKERDTAVFGNMANVHNPDSGHCFNKNSFTKQGHSCRRDLLCSPSPSDLSAGWMMQENTTF